MGELQEELLVYAPEIKCFKKLLLNQNNKKMKNKALITEDNTTSNFENLQQLEDFLHKLSDKLGSTKLRTGSDLTSYLKSYKLEAPGFLGSGKIVYEGYHDELGKSKRKLVIVTKPDKEYTEPMARKIFCVRTRWGVACLECGWIWCRVVIYY